MNQSENINELAMALAKAQGELQPAIKDSNNPYFKSKYADLASVWNACRDPLSKNGIAVIQTVQETGDKIVLVTTMVHSSGQWIKSFLPVITQKQDAQSIGAAITYMRRFSLSAIVGISTEDDDGNIANGRVSPPLQQTQAPRKNETISQQQLSALIDKLEKVPHYMANVKKTLATCQPQVFDFKDITPPMFEGIMRGADQAYQTQLAKSA